MCEGKPIPFTEVQLVDDQGAVVPEGTVGHLLMRGDNVTRGYFQNPEANAAALTPDGWLRTGDLALLLDGELYVTGRSKEIIFVNGQNYYPHDLESVLQAEPGLELGKVVAAGARTPSLAHGRAGVVRAAPRRHGRFHPARDEGDALDQRACGRRSRARGAGQAHPENDQRQAARSALAKAFEDGEFAAELAEFDAAWATVHGHGRAAKGRIEAQLKAIVDDAMPGKHVDVDDNLFDVGASSLTLIQIHEKIDEAYPGAVDLTELFDYPRSHCWRSDSRRN